MAALYNHYKGTSHLWEYNSAYDMTESLRFIRNSMIYEIQSKNHALISSLSLIRKNLAEDFVKLNLNKYLIGRFSTDIYPAALAIALHDESMLTKLPNPILFEEMPLAFLLVYCDLVQESGRSEEAEVVDLKNFLCEQGRAESTLVFAGANEYNKKFQEMERVFDRISCRSIEFKLFLRHAGSECSRTTSVIKDGTR